MKKRFIKLLFSALLLAGLISYGQTRKLNKANKQYDGFAYIDAAAIYLQVAESGYQSEELFQKLGNTYYFKANYQEAARWYKALFALNNGGSEFEYFLRYSQSLKALGLEKEAERMFDTYLNKSGVLSDEFSSSLDYLTIIRENSNRYDIEPLPLNSEGTDYGGFLYEDTFYFASTRNLKHRPAIDAWNKEPFLDIYSVAYNREGKTYGEVEPVEGDVNTKFHESSAAITSDGKTLYFTRTNNTPRIKKSKKEKVQLKIYRATKVDGEWTNIEDLSINGDNYSNAHPALSPDDKVLYFASDMPASIGQTDIFSVAINENGSLGKPINLGPEINTRGRESFPFITNGYELYFSSDGHFGLGGYDVFYMDLKKQGMQLLNVGGPVNGPADDFAFSINTEDKTGFFSSNRDQIDNIFSFKETKPISQLLEASLSGKITNEESADPIANATIEIINKDTGLSETIKSDENGRYMAIINKFEPHTVRISKKGYDTTDKFIGKGQDSYQADFQLTRNVFELSENADLAKMLNIQHIYFDFDSAVIRDDARVELEKVVAAMQQHANLQVDVRSYTDSRADDAYNLLLSDKRAKATIDYLVSRGINEDRLSGKGYGETQLLNNCDNNTKCSDAEHQKNRRSEFIISAI
ncbi:OmpA family protein [Seonamhaeicola sp.]|uniref:OmpA family protein n=1 Tax=Seonamhaeicola sp. TaxID=1912245 RepID=UPI002621B5E5|nr:OmpA family protein [Seonamhaeicola sp.]